MPAFTQVSNYTPEQMQLFKSLFANVSPESYLGKLAGGDQSFFEQIEAPALRQFQGLQGQIGSRFSGGLGSGAMSARRSSGFNNTVNQATSDFAQDLQARRQGLQQQAIRDLMGMSNDLLNQRSFDLVRKPQKSGGFFSSLLGGSGGLIGGALGSFLGPIGSMAGSSIGNSLFGSSGGQSGFGNSRGNLGIY
jgi:hypothetical protein